MLWQDLRKLSMLFSCWLSSVIFLLFKFIIDINHSIVRRRIFSETIVISAEDIVLVKIIMVYTGI